MWDGTPIKTPPGGNLFLLIGGWTHCFTILFSYWFSISTIKNPIVSNCAQPKKKRKCHTNPIPCIWMYLGEFRIWRDYIPRNWQHTSGTILQMWETTFGSHRIHLRKTGVSSISVMVWNPILRKALKNAALRNVTFQQVGGWLGTMNQGDPRNTSKKLRIVFTIYYDFLCVWLPFGRWCMLGRPPLPPAYTSAGLAPAGRKIRYPKIHWFIFQIKMIKTARTWGKSW